MLHSSILTKIQRWQRLMNVSDMRDAINDGTAFLDTETIEVAARYMYLGLCHLPFKSYVDVYGNVVPTVYDKKIVQMGSIDNCALFYGLLQLRLN